MIKASFSLLALPSFFSLLFHSAVAVSLSTTVQPQNNEEMVEFYSSVVEGVVVDKINASPVSEPWCVAGVYKFKIEKSLKGQLKPGSVIEVGVPTFDVRLGDRLILGFMEDFYIFQDECRDRGAGKWFTVGSTHLVPYKPLSLLKVNSGGKSVNVKICEGAFPIMFELILRKNAFNITRIKQGEKLCFAVDAEAQ